MEKRTDPFELGETIGEIVAKRRAQMELSQQAIADALRIRSPEFIGLVERGTRRLDLNRIPALARVLELPADRLIEKAIAEIAPDAHAALFGQPTRASHLENRDAGELLDLFYILDEIHRKDLLVLLRVWIDKRIEH